MFAKINRKLHKLPVNYDELSKTDRANVRAIYVKNQKNRCYYCNAYLTGEPPAEIISMKIHKELFPPEFFNYSTHLHHNHITGLTIGAVHAWCNAVMWEYEGE